MWSSLSESRVSGISSISRIKGIAWNTVARWLEKAAQVCHRFNHRRIAGFAAKELSNKKTPSCFVTIEVWSRLWPSRVTGRRSYRNTHALFRDLSRRMSFGRQILPEGHRFFGPACLYGALLHGPEQIADLPVPVAESPGAVRIGHPERSHLVEYLAPNSVFNSLPRQRSSPHLRPDDRLVTIDRVLHHASLGVV